MSERRLEGQKYTTNTSIVPSSHPVEATVHKLGRHIGISLVSKGPPLQIRGIIKHIFVIPSLKIIIIYFLQASQSEAAIEPMPSILEDEVS
jgi:hypothetical protein